MKRRHKKKLRDPFERFIEKVKKTDTCWVWIAGKTHGGYGAMYLNGKPIRAHIFSYLHYVGEYDRTLVLDHLCRNPACVNPEHLEPVTHKENIRRGINGKRGYHKTLEARARTHCKNGHEYTPGNTYINPKGARICRKCKNARQRERRREKDLENLKKYTEMLKNES